MMGLASCSLSAMTMRSSGMGGAFEYVFGVGWVVMVLLARGDMDERDDQRLGMFLRWSCISEVPMGRRKEGKWDETKPA